MSSVRNRIASFEAHNDDIRKATSPPESPSSGCGGAQHEHHYQKQQPISPHVVSPYNSSVSDYSPERPTTSTTAAASQSRIHRLQQQQQQQQQPRGSRSNINKKASVLQARRLMGVADTTTTEGKMTVTKRTSSSSNSSARRQRQQQRQLSSSESQSQQQQKPSQTQQGGNRPGASLLSHRRVGGTTTTTTTTTYTGSATTTGASGMQSKAMEYAQNKRHQQQQQQQMHQQQNSNSMLQQPKLEHTTRPQTQTRQRTKQQHDQQSLLNNSTSTAVTSNVGSSATTAANQSSSAAARNSRLGKIQRIKKMRNTLHGNNHSSRQQDQAHLTQAQQQHPPPNNMLSSSSNDDDITLTSVRQVIAREKQQQQDSMRKNEPHSPPSLRRKDGTGTSSSSSRHWSMRGGGEEKSDKDYVHRTSLSQPSPRGIVMARSSSSEYDTDNGGDNHSREGGNSAGLFGPSMSASQLTPTPNLGAAFFEHRRRVANHDEDKINSSTAPPSRMNKYNSSGNGNKNSNINGISSNREDDDTYDYSGRDEEDRINGLNKGRQTTFDSPTAFNDDDSQGSMSYSQKREKEAKAKEELARKHAAEKAKAGMDNPFMQAEGFEQYRKAFDNPTARTALGVAAAATVGLAVVGPVGLLLGAAAVGIGVGVMQIPEEQRSNMCDKATETLKGAQETAMTASEAISSSCANTYRDSGIEEHIPEDMKQCCTAIEEEVKNVNSSDRNNINGNDNGERGTGKGGGAAGGGGAGNGGVDGGTTGYDNNVPNESLGNRDGGPFHSALSPIRFGNQKNDVACLREGKIVPLSQIHALSPAAQPRAFLDILASAETKDDEKTEAMEEILILAKDKQRARIFLEEGILDSIMWTLGRYFEKLDLQQQKDNSITADASSNSNTDNNWANPEITAQEAAAARLAAICCLTLGKSHCAAIHTGGDLLLMSMYERGTVPEERQLAQMLHEVPHHTRTIKPNDDPTIVRDPSNENFVLKQMSLPQAEELAKRIKEVAYQRI